MREYLRSAIGKYESQLVREPFTVVQDFCSVFFLFFPVIDELDGAPMSDVTIFAFAENAVKHASSTEQPHMPTMQRSEWPAPDVAEFRKEDSACLSICGRLQQQVLNLIQWNSR